MKKLSLTVCFGIFALYVQAQSNTNGNSKSRSLFFFSPLNKLFFMHEKRTNNGGISKSTGRYKSGHKKMSHDYGLYYQSQWDSFSLKTFSYDSNGNLIQKTEWHFDTIFSRFIPSYRYSYSYDSNNRITED